MCFKTPLLHFITILFCQISFSSTALHRNSPQNETLVTVHVIFRHGDKTPEETYPSDPYKDEAYKPYGRGQLTHIGKQCIFHLGRMFREKYKFVGDTYKWNTLKAWTTTGTATQMSLQLFLAAFFAEDNQEIWDQSINWQPVPYETAHTRKDRLLFAEDECPNYKRFLDETKIGAFYQDIQRNYAKTFEYISYNSGIENVNLDEASILYDILNGQESWGLKLPNWVNTIYPDVLQKIVRYKSELETWTTPLKQMRAGLLISKIMNDTMEQVKNDAENKITTKMFLYSGNSRIVAAVLNTLEAFKSYVVPFGGAVVFEVHKINGKYGIKVFSTDCANSQGSYLEILHCDEFCPLEQAKNLLNNFYFNTKTCGTPAMF